MYARLVLLTALSFISANALAADAQTGDSPSERKTIEKPPLSEKMQALLDAISTPEQALEDARKYQENGQYGLAKIVLKHGIELANSAGTDREELVNELEYAMPMLQARERLVSGFPDEAEVILDRLEKQFAADHKRSVEIGALKGALGQSKILAAARSNNERVVTNDVRHRLSNHYKQQGVFPSYAELNKILPPGDKILQNYEVVYYQVVRNAYRLVLRNTHNSDNFLKIEATGLIK